MKIAVIGLGLIGGSFCKSIKKYTAHTCWGWDEDEFVLQKAAMEGAIDASVTPGQLAKADLTIVCLHPETAIDFMLEHQAKFRPGSMVIDTCGVKQAIVEAVSPALQARGVYFVGAHPMAGREFSGYDYALAELYQGASFIVTPDAQLPPEMLAALTELVKELGFAQVVQTTPLRHDQTIAFTSQLAHVVSSAYVKCPLADKHRGFSAGSFADMTRVARLNEDMWTELFFDNREALLPVVEDLVQRVTEYRDALRDEDREGMRKLLREGRETKERLTD